MSQTISPITGLTYRESLNRDGFVTILQVLNTEELESLRAAAKRSIDLARDNKWPYLRTLPKQFPPWEKTADNGIWGVQHLMHPDLPDHELFTATYFNPKVISVIKELLGNISDDKLVMELYNMLITPDQNFALRWH